MAKKKIRLTESQLISFIEKSVQKVLGEQSVSPDTLTPEDLKKIEQNKAKYGTGGNAGKNLRKRARNTHPDMTDKEISQRTKRTNAGKIIKIVKDALIGAGLGVGAATAIAQTMDPADLDKLDVAQVISGLAGASVGTAYGDVTSNKMSQKQHNKRGARLRKRLGYDSVNENKGKKKVIRLTESQLTTFIENSIKKTSKK